MVMQMSKGKVSLKDIAKKINTTPATVSRALNNRPGVSEELRNKIIEVANEMGYVPNVMAREIRAEKRNILVLFPVKDYNASFYTDLLWKGYEKGKSEQSMHEVDWYEFYLEGEDLTHSNEIKAEKLQEYINAGVKFDGVIIYQAGYHKQLFSLIEKLDRENVPIIAIHKTMDELKYTSLITDDSYTIGKLAAEMLHKFGKKQKQILLVENSEDALFGKDETSQGFQEEITRLFPDIIIKKIDQFSPDLLDFSTSVLNDENTTGLFATTARAGIFLSKLVEINEWQDRFFLITTVLNYNSKQALKKGVVKCILDNHPEREGVEAVRVLFNILVFNNEPIKEKKIPLRILFESNIDNIDGNYE